MGQVEKRRIGMIRGPDSFGIESRIREEFDRVDAIDYGPTRTPACRRVKGVTFFDAGSFTRPFGGRPILGILHGSREIEGEVIRL